MTFYCPLATTSTDGQYLLSLPSILMDQVINDQLSTVLLNYPPQQFFRFGMENEPVLNSHFWQPSYSSD